LLKAEARKTTDSISDGLQRLIDDRISDALSRLGIAKAEDIAALTSRIELLEQKIAKNS
jgi:polyhydroxyalkanoate synthesis regulator phasin